jgi:hypothetical protein
MIAEENILNNEQPNISVPKSSIVLLIIESMKKTVPYFKSYIISDFYKKSKLSEDDFSQIYIEQAQILARKQDYPFNISSQYRDIYNLSKGFSDFYFYPNEQEISTISLFSVESKRLPSPDKAREKEYVIGDANNGGIERYKTEKHGKGLNECGLLGFVEEENSNYWITTINNWIKDLAQTDKNWNEDELLSEFESNTDFCLLKSIAHRKAGNINLIHLWIMQN